MKKTMICCVLACVMMISLSACDKKEEKEWADAVPTPKPTASAPVVPEQSGTAQRNVQYEETLANGLHIQVFSDGELLLDGGNVEENLKNHNIFASHVADIKTLHLGDGVESVGDKCFQGWDKLTRIVIGDSVKKIGYYSFSACSAVTDVSFGRSLETIDDYAFSGCVALKDASLSESVTSVGDYAFSKCTYLQNARFGRGVTHMGRQIFDGCKGFTDFKTGSDIPAQALEGNTTIINLSLEDSVEQIGERAFSGCTSLRTITWSPNLTKIGSYAFFGCKALNLVDIEACGELAIGDSAFEGCSELTTVTLAEGVYKVGARCFADCKKLDKIVLPKTIRQIGESFLAHTEKLRILGYRGTASDWYNLKDVYETKEGEDGRSTKWFYDAGTSAVTYEIK